MIELVRAPALVSLVGPFEVAINGRGRQVARFCRDHLLDAILISKPNEYLRALTEPLIGMLCRFGTVREGFPGLVEKGSNLRRSVVLAIFHCLVGLCHRASPLPQVNHNTAQKALLDT